MDNSVLENKDRVTVYLEDCMNGLGMKICGGIDENENNVGIFVKEILKDGIAEKSGQISTGNQILYVNGYSFSDVTQVDAVSFLRMSAQTGSVLLVLDKSEEAYEQFLSVSTERELQRNRGASFKRSSLRSHVLSNIENELSCERQLSSLDSQISPLQKKKAIHHSDENPSVKIITPSNDSGFPRSTPFVSPESTGYSSFPQDQVRTATINKKSSLGITVRGGINSFDGPNVVVASIIPGGDVYEHGEICVGDTIISINGESFVDVKNEQAKLSLSRLKLRNTGPNHIILYVPNTKPSTEKLALTDHCHNSFVNSTENAPVTKVFELRKNSLASSQDISEDIQSPGSSGDPMLKELLDLMADIQDSEVGSMVNDQRHIGSNYTMPFIENKENINGPYNTISHYLHQDVNIKNQHGQSTLKRQNRNNFSLSPVTPIKLEKLEAALKHLGVHTTLVERNEIRGLLKSNMYGEVLYGDFVGAVREVMQLDMQLDSHDQMLQTNTIVFNENSTSKMAIYREDMDRLKHERDESMKDAQYFRNSLYDKDRSCLALQDELDRYKQELAIIRKEYDIMRQQRRQLKDSQQQSKTNEHDYEQVIRKMEKEISSLRKQLKSPQDEFVDLQKRLVVIGCQLRKTEISKRTYEVGLEKLTRFVENIHVTLENEIKKNDSTSTSNRRRQKKLERLSNEARETVKSVKLLLEEEPLPFGWEEVYSEDGSRYFMNHVTQTTSWIHPVSGVQHSNSKQ